MSKTIAFDANWYLHRIFHTSNDALSETIASRLLSLLCKDALAVRAKQMVVAFDGNRVFRYKIDEDYKSTRKKDKESDGGTDEDGPYTHLPYVLKYLESYGIPVIQMKEYEADDVLCSIAYQYRDVVAACHDKDAYQYVLRPDIVLYNSNHKVNGVPSPQTTTKKDIPRLFGVESHQCLDLQTLVGDGIDNIPQILKRSKAIKGLKEHGSIKNWMAADSEFRRLMSKNKHRLITNRKLVKLIPDLKIEIKPIKWNSDPKAPTSYIKLKEFCNPKSKGLFSS